MPCFDSSNCANQTSDNRKTANQINCIQCFPSRHVVLPHHMGLRTRGAARDLWRAAFWIVFDESFRFCAWRRDRDSGCKKCGIFNKRCFSILYWDKINGKGGFYETIMRAWKKDLADKSSWANQLNFLVSYFHIFRNHLYLFWINFFLPSFCLTPYFQ